jgi:class 3 adenylate cyclase
LAVREHREAARPIVAGLGGRIVKTMGDGLLLCFGGESETMNWTPDLGPWVKV